MRQSKHNKVRPLRLTAVLAAVLTLGLTACDSSVEPMTSAEETDEMVEMLTAELSLSTGEAQEVAVALEANEPARMQREPGWSWILADRLQQALSDDKKAALIALTERIEEREVFGLVCFVGPGGLTGPDWLHRPVFRNRLQVLRLISGMLTDEQAQEIRSIVARYRDAIKALVRQAKAGEITREEFVESMRALHADAVAAVYDVLTEDQKAAIEEAIQDRIEAFEAIVAAAKRAMYEALDATEAQVDEIENLCDRLSTEKDVLLDQHYSGEITRDELKTALNGLNEAEKEALESFLDETQMEVVLIHKAILLRWRRVELRLHRRHFNGRVHAGDAGELFGTRETRFG